MRIAVTLVVTTVVALTLVVAKPHGHGKAESRDIDDEIEWFLAKLERRVPGAGQKSSPIERKAIPKSKKETQSFHKIRTTSKLSNLVYRAPAKAGLISKTDKKDAPNPKNEKLLSLSAQSESQSTKSDRRTVDNHRVVNAKEKEDMLKFLNEKLSQKRAKSDGRLKNPSVKELSEARLVRNATTSENSEMRQFKKDGSTARVGFPNVLTGCGGKISGPTGSITSPNYPNNYGNNLNCVYHVIVEAGKVILFTFTNFETEPHATCHHDSVTVYDGDSINAPYLGLFCGSDIPPPTATSGNYGTLQLRTDGSNTRTGFFVNYVASNSDEVVTTIPSSCGGTFSGPSGIIRSPHYPSHYENNLDCVYHVTVETGKVIVFTFTDIDLESHASCNSDSVTVHDGDSINALSLGKFCGSVAPPSTATLGNSGTVRFKTDGSSTRTGFSIDYVASDGSSVLTGCGGQTSGPSGYITSPNYPNNYDSNLDCVYHVTVETGKVILFTFTSFETEPHATCHYDSVTVYDGGSTNAHYLGTFCGSDIPPPIATSGNSGTLQLRTDSSNTRSGFFVNYVASNSDEVVTTIPSSCGGIFSGPSGIIRSPHYPNNYENNLECVYYITVETGKVIAFTFTDIDLESHSSCNFDSVTVHDGESINARSLGKFCGTVAPPPSTTSGNAGTVRFKTDGSTTRTGFSIDYVARDGW